MSATLTQLIAENAIIPHADCSSWEESITAAARPLLVNGFITERYVDSMIKAVREFGAYIVLGPHVALAHARPDDGVLKMGMSILTLEQPVYFGHPDNDPVQIVFCLASPDNKSHLAALKGFVKIAGDADRLRRIAAAGTVEDIRKILQENS